MLASMTVRVRDREYDTYKFRCVEIASIRGCCKCRRATAYKLRVSVSVSVGTGTCRTEEGPRKTCRPRLLPRKRPRSPSADRVTEGLKPKTITHRVIYTGRRSNARGRRRSPPGMIRRPTGFLVPFDPSGRARVSGNASRENCPVAIARPEIGRAAMDPATTCESN